MAVDVKETGKLGDRHFMEADVKKLVSYIIMGQPFYGSRRQSNL